MPAARKPENNEPPISARPRPLWLGAAITLLAPLLVLFAQHVPLPGVDASAFERKTLFGGPPGLSIASLGVMPFISASGLVEVVALVVPSFRPLRHGGYAGRRKLLRAAVLLALAIAVFQAWNTASLLAAVPEFGSSSHIVILTLVAALGLTHLLAQTVDRYGLASGYGALFASISFVTMFTELEASKVTARDVAALLGAIAVAAAVTWYVLERSAPEALPRRTTESYRNAAVPEEAPPLWLPAPSSGLSAFSNATSVISLAVMFGVGGVLANDTVRRAIELSLALGAAVFFTYLFHQPDRVAEVFARARGAGASRSAIAAEAAALRMPAAMKSAVLLFALLAVDVFAAQISPKAAAAWTTPLFVALVLDIAAELRARRSAPNLVAVWPEHSPYAIAAARDALHAEGIFVHARGERMRRLLQFFGPYVPIDLMVPEKHAERAEAILREVLLSREAAAETMVRPLEQGKAKARPIGAGVVAALVVLAGLMLGLTLWPKNEPQAPEKRSVSLAFVAVDDDHEIVSDAAIKNRDEKALPAGLSFAQEQVSIGPGRQAVHVYARLVRGEGETMESARARLDAWTKSIPLPEGDRAALSEFVEYDDIKDSYEVVGFRTYLQKGAPILTEADVADATAMVDTANGGEGWLVRVQFTPEGAARFESFTAEHVKRRLAIVVDGLVMSAPVIQTKIPGGVVTITMGNKQPEQQKAEAQKLAEALGGR